MNQKSDWMRILLKTVSYIFVAALSSALTLFLCMGGSTKLTELETVIKHQFIGEADMEELRDAAAQAMVSALGDRWSYYISAEDYAAYQEKKNNAYASIGMTISARADGTGYDILAVEPGGSAQEGGILPGDILVEVDRQDVTSVSIDEIKALIRGVAGTKISIGVLRDGEKLSFTLKRGQIRVEVASGKMLPGNIGFVRVNNFNANCASETIQAVEQLIEQGAQGLIFDVRNNPGGYIDEMIELLDYLLPEGVLFQELDYKGNFGKEISDNRCLEMPMVVLINGNSYSAAEFFAAVLQEYEWASLVGEQTTGKGYYQVTSRLSDGSAVNLSVGKYFTPNGVNLTDVGGLVPEVLVPVDEQMASMIYAQVLEPTEDPQIQAALAQFDTKEE